MITEAELVARIDLVVTRLVTRLSPDIIVIACNTASTIALPMLRDKIAQPIIGVVPAIKPAAIIRKTKYVGLLATPGTIERSYTQDLIEDFGRGSNENPIDWIKVGSSSLVSLIEKNVFGGGKFPCEQLNEILDPFMNKDASELDTIVLACTHFPLIIDKLKAKLPHVKNWVDSGKAIADRVEFILNKKEANNHETICLDHFAVVTQDICKGLSHSKKTFIDNKFQAEGLRSIRVFEV